MNIEKIELLHNIYKYTNIIFVFGIICISVGIITELRFYSSTTYYDFISL